MPTSNLPDHNAQRRFDNGSARARTVRDLARVVAALGDGQDLAHSVLASVEDGVQIWDHRGRLLYANPASDRHFGDMSGLVGESYARLVSRCLDDEGRPLINSRFPVARVLEREGTCTGITIGIQPEKGKWLEINAFPIGMAGGKGTGVLSTSHDISAHVEKTRQLELHAHRDALTGLPNRNILSDRMNLAIAHSRRRNNIFAVCLMDLDGFKPINDKLGHEAGDRLLQEIARRLLSTLREEDTVIRLGGDEFVLLLDGLTNERECESVLRRVLESVAAPFSHQGQQVQVTASLGVTLYPNDAVDADLLLRHADQAMYKAKEQGKNDFFLFDATLESRRRANRNTLDRMRKALLNDQFELYYQPQVDCSKGKVVGVEALIRWNHPVLGIRSPAEFLPLVEHDELIVRLGEWVMDQALRQVQNWRRQGIEIGIGVGVNISAHHLLHTGFGRRLDLLLDTFPSDLMAMLEIEVLETAAVEDLRSVGRLVSQYQERGISFALDDFGTGFSSLAHLKHLAVNTLKVDRSFVRDMMTDSGDLAIVQGILGLSEAFQTRVIAEGVESIDQILLMLEMGCSIMQGYAIARPMPASKIPNWLKSFRPNPLWHTASRSYPSRQYFDLLLMEVMQQQWLARVKQAVAAGEDSRDHPTLHYGACRLTAWYQEQGAKRYGALPEFHELDILHRRVHDLAERLMVADKRDKAELLLQLNSASDKLKKALRHFRTVAAGNPG